VPQCVVIACKIHKYIASSPVQSLSLIPVLNSTLTISSFPLVRDREEYTGHENLKDFTVTVNPRSIEEIFDGSPALALHRSAQFFGLFLVSGQVSSRDTGME